MGECRLQIVGPASTILDVGGISRATMARMSRSVSGAGSGALSGDVFRSGGKPPDETGPPVVEQPASTELIKRSAASVFTG
ncbi:MAG: hypothetical protein IPJ38_22155 [Dechloromonas sp.]|uniref:Uncharacterized protein n=1 Tax=Candidatus Dechloromonas phosphorivorans TaxID=2899244 RepID=A0A935MXN7_9RHOO|nr:hypothetical protein [Candidatus Dechloromonas phosphorivorans]